MASSGLDPDNGPLSSTQGHAGQNAVEMNNLNISTQSTADSQAPTQASASTAMADPPTSTANADLVQPSAVRSIPADHTSKDTLASATPATTTGATPEPNRSDAVAIGPSVDHGLPSAPTPSVTDPVCNITLLLTSGARHPYKLDERYLTKRSVSVPGVTESGRKDPFSISVYTLKELILREWREEWEAQPSSPSSIRLIHFGRLLDDKTPLKECRFNHNASNVVHMTIRPQEVVDDEEASKSKALRGEREGTERTPGCRCVIL